MKTPFFSIVIPTYNRPKELERAIKSILSQSFKNFEIVISDNHKGSKVSKLSPLLNNKQIRYYFNDENIGFTRNLYKAIGLAKGEYVFILGDDDWLGNLNLLENVYQKIKNKGYGYIRVSFLYCSQNNKRYSLFLDQKTNRTLGKNQNSLEILDFLDRSVYSSISGLIFKRPASLLIKSILQSQNPKFEMSDFWVKYLFDAVRKAGGWIDFEDVIYVSLSQYESPTFYLLINNRLPREMVWELFKNDLSKKEMKTWIKNETANFSRMLPSIRYYSSRTNLIAFTKRLLQLNSGLKWEPSFHFKLFVAVVMPRWLWRWLRAIAINCSTRFL
ncbi:hypothetical protein CO083_02520 [Candidatus Roizmanbacteria bacterium CG_4_9_14_0_8_um_filter_34_12]|uniref:Glycosyltransferase 2-like domain-containing protein n=2 Tax=Candidatus Roizmaniibacteriota TaxID=1752723 RepID=A0A2M8DD68_9BACT|nr:MAG: hypothetical protein CO083_02520 [Candidatus Roizmanbacteria bacterium CG_4_9_14_0_8_um_filter_34_12]PJC32483.1 MAG: hypothetical protein CO049_02865 [Candidatus Roizmanbacteria bacterium CG_4_9_14_0_2_um_filter_36_12]